MLKKTLHDKLKKKLIKKNTNKKTKVHIIKLKTIQEYGQNNSKLDIIDIQLICNL